MFHGRKRRTLRRALHPLRVASRRWRWPALGVLAAVAFGLGFWGFSWYFTDIGESRSVGDRLYLTAQLFALDSGSVDPPVPWPLEVARFLAGFVSIAIGLGALAAIFRNQLDHLRARVRGRPVVVFGLGSYGSLLARNFSRAGYRVTGVERAAKPAVDKCRADGVTVVVGDATDPHLLDSIGLHRADVLLLVSGDEATNVELAVSIAEQLHRNATHRRRQRGDRAVRCFVHVEEMELCALLRESPVVRPLLAKVVALEFFNPSELMAPLMLDEHDVLDVTASHRLLVGLGQTGCQLALFAARSWWFHHREPLHLTIVDSDVEARWERLRVLEPQLETHSTVERLAHDVADPAFAREFANQYGSGEATKVSAAYVCVDTDAHALMASLVIRDQLNAVGNTAPVIVRMLGREGLASMLDPSSGFTASGVYPCAVADWSARPEIVLERDTERLARFLHADYVREREREGLTVKQAPAMRPWEELGHEQRESNRDQARDVDRKLWAVGCVRRPLTDFVGELVRFDHDEVELLGRMEHDRWWEFKRACGYKYGNVRTNTRHPDMIPWEDLDDEIREYDRIFVRGMPLFLLRTGYLVERLTAVLDRSIREIEAGGVVPSAPRGRDPSGAECLAALTDTGWEIRLAVGGRGTPESSFTSDAVERVIAAGNDSGLRAETIKALPARLAGVDVGIFRSAEGTGGRRGNA